MTPTMRGLKGKVGAIWICESIRDLPRQVNVSKVVLQFSGFHKRNLFNACDVQYLVFMNLVIGLCFLVRIRIYTDLKSDRQLPQVREGM